MSAEIQTFARRVRDQIVRQGRPRAVLLTSKGPRSIPADDPLVDRPINLMALVGIYNDRAESNWIAQDIIWFATHGRS